MRAVVLSGPNQFAPAEIEKPQIGPDEILLEMKAAAICGTDMRILTGKKTKGVRYPSVIGHEFCGVIAEVGADVKGYEVGEKVAVANVIPCHHCSSCLRGRTNACLDRKAIGYEFDGGFEEYIRIPAICIENGNVVKLPEHVSYQAGALIEPLSCCIRGLKNAGTGFNDDVLSPTSSAARWPWSWARTWWWIPPRRTCPPSSIVRPTVRAWTSLSWPSACPPL